LTADESSDCLFFVIDFLHKSFKGTLFLRNEESRAKCGITAIKVAKHILTLIHLNHFNCTNYIKATEANDGSANWFKSKSLKTVTCYQIHKVLEK
jgi:hypothetical protein